MVFVRGAAVRWGRRDASTSFGFRATALSESLCWGGGFSLPDLVIGRVRPQDVARAVDAHPTLPDAVKEAALAVGTRAIYI